jgi:predicted transglutaminase-like cysteine proteinase
LRRPSAILIALLLLLCDAGLARAASSGLFGTQELYSSNLAPFAKWDGVVVRTEAEHADPRGLCVPADRACVADWWRNFVAELANLPLRERVERANAVLNRVRYVTAEANWHDPDHWETPFEFLVHGGQCEDYAIAKFMALEQSGVPEAELRFVVVRDTLESADHAVTVVYVDGEALVLDNQADAVLPARTLARYVPYYSINRSGWWYHVSAGGLVARASAPRVAQNP